MPRPLALLVTDLVDSTRLVERLGDARAAELGAACDHAARELVVAHRGREIDKTDGFLLLFDDPAHAVEYALAYHQALDVLSAEFGVALHARAGVHVGPVILRENPPEHVRRGAKPIEVEGRAKPIAARVMALAGARQTLVTADARALLGDHSIGDSVVVHHGHWQLKGVQEPVAIFEVGVPGVAPLSPPPDAEKAWRMVRAQEEVWVPARSVPRALPRERDAFVGRDEDLRALAGWLDGEARLVTLLGPGGMGKTRLALRYAWVWLGGWPGGAWFCDLSDARDVDGICSAVAAALDVPLGRGDSVAQLGHALAARGRALFVLDNFEQVARHAGGTLGRWLDRATEAAFLVTTRQVLGLPGERVLPLAPLPTPRHAAGADDRGGVELFVTRARAARGGWAPAAEELEHVATLVRMLDGLPLAIELAAARMRIMTASQMVERMSDRFRLLGAAAQRHERHTTLRKAIDWSWNLLAPAERSALAQLAVFEGGFTLEAAEGVLALPDDAPWATDVVQALVDQSLVWPETGNAPRHPLDGAGRGPASITGLGPAHSAGAQPASGCASAGSVRDSRSGAEGGGLARFRMYESIREYALSRLREATPAAAGGASEAAAAEACHGAWFAAAGAPDAIRALRTRGGERRRVALAAELDNLLAACRRAVARGDTRVAAATVSAVSAVVQVRGPATLGVAIAELVLAMPELTGRERATVEVAAARCLQQNGRGDAARALLEQAIARHGETGDEVEVARAVDHLGILCLEQGRLEEAFDCHERALAVYRRARSGDESKAVMNLGLAHFGLGRLAEARACYEEALATYTAVGDRYSEGLGYSNLGTVLTELGLPEEARRHYQTALAANRDAGDRRSTGITLGNLALVEHALGRFDDALRTYEAATALHREVGNRRSEALVGLNHAQLEAELGRPAEARARLAASLAILREVGDRRIEGAALTVLGLLVGRGGAHAEGLGYLRDGEAALRAVKDRVELAKVLLARAEIEHLAGAPAAARAAFDEGSALADACGLGPDSEAGRARARVQEMFGCDEMPGTTPRVPSNP